MPRIKGSKNKVSKKVTKPVVLKAKAIKAKANTKKLKSLVNESSDTQIKAVLSHILDLFKAALKDAFRGYVDMQIKSGRTPSVEEFMVNCKHTVARHGITKEELLSALDDAELESLTNAQAKEVVKNVPVATATETPAKRKAKATPVTAPVAAALPHVTTEIKGGQVTIPGTEEPEVDPLDPIANKATSESNGAGTTSVFDQLDLI